MKPGSWWPASPAPPATITTAWWWSWKSWLPNRRFSVEARVFDEVAAFRYLLPSQTGLQEARLVGERTRFNFAKDATTYPLILANFRTSYEDNYVKLPLSALKADSLVALPLLAELPGNAWVAITEAHIENYAGMYLVHPSARELESRLAPQVDNPKIAVITPAPMQSPWRVMMIADHPGRFVESNIVLNLNPPAAIADTSWIKAGRSAWNWWSGSYAEGNFKPGMNNDTMKYYIDFASSAKFEYMLIDAGWAAGTPGGTGSTSAWSSTRGKRTSSFGFGPTGPPSTSKWTKLSRSLKSGASPASRSTSWTATTSGWSTGTGAW